MISIINSNPLTLNPKTDLIQGEHVTPGTTSRLSTTRKTPEATGQSRTSAGGHQLPPGTASHQQRAHRGPGREARAHWSPGQGPEPAGPAGECASRSPLRLRRRTHGIGGAGRHLFFSKSVISMDQKTDFLEELIQKLDQSPPICKEEMTKNSRGKARGREGGRQEQVRPARSPGNGQLPVVSRSGLIGTVAEAGGPSSRAGVAAAGTEVRQDASQARAGQSPGSQTEAGSGHLGTSWDRWELRGLVSPLGRRPQSQWW